VLGQITSRFRDHVRAFAEAEGIPLISFAHGERKDDQDDRHLRNSQKKRD
jgi:hypothetical protein